MAIRTIVHLEDDLSGGAAHESVRFALDGRLFEIDLSEKNASQLRRIFAPYIRAGRPVRGALGRSHRATSNGGGGLEPATVRAWASENGYAVPTRGRVSRELREAYLAARG
jgi:nucleoid-associated protein Lsr2